MQRVKAIWAGFLRFKDWMKELVSEFGLEAMLFAIALGNADVLHHYLIQTGSANTWQLKVAIYATELLVVWASLWRTVGLFISAVLFFVSMTSIRSVFDTNWIGHSGFSLAIFCGSLGNYVRRGGWIELGTAWNFLRGKAPVKALKLFDIVGLSATQIKDKFTTTLTHAMILKQLATNGVKITDRLVEETRC